ncbi:hypothetical protein VN0212_02610 [Helicobacter pylori]|nr:hypothetical protein VN0212_02610 [Helicobacter pylori]
MLKWCVAFFVLIEEGSKNQNLKEGKNERQNFKNISLWVIFLGLERPFMGERQWLFRDW